MKILVNSCIRKIDKIGMRRISKSCAGRDGSMQLTSSEEQPEGACLTSFNYINLDI